MDVKRKSQKQEKRVAKELGGRVTPASGALWGAKGDVRSEYFLVECKVTSKSSYPLKDTIWDKIAKEALHDNMREPVMCIELNDNEPYALVYKSAFEESESFCNLVASYPVYRIKGRQKSLSGPCCLIWESRYATWELVMLPWSNFIEIAEEYTALYN